MRPQTQITGRMGELIVELELLKRGWWVTNFNTSVSNFIGWDLFAVKDGRSIKIRVKSKRPGEPMLRWNACSDKNVFPNLELDDKDDFTAIVSFDDSAKGHQVYLIPSLVIEKTLSDNHLLFLSGKKKNGDERKNTKIRIVYLDEKENVFSHGYAKKWSTYFEAWNSLEKAVKKRKNI